MSGFLVSVGIIFAAELGDKSQLMALAFAARYPAVPILVGITLATAAVHAVSVVIGAALGVALPATAISVAAGLAFFGFAAWTLRGDTLAEEEAGRAARSSRSAVVAAAGAFFLAEVGDKTMLATIALATDQSAFGVWAGSTVGMVAADGLAIVVGQQLGARVPERPVRIGAAVLFVLFGLLLLADAVRGTLSS